MPVSLQARTRCHVLLQIPLHDVDNPINNASGSHEYVHILYRLQKASQTQNPSQAPGCEYGQSKEESELIRSESYLWSYLKWYFDVTFHWKDGIASKQWAHFIFPTKVCFFICFWDAIRMPHAVHNWVKHNACWNLHTHWLFCSKFVYLKSTQRLFLGFINEIQQLLEIPAISHVNMIWCESQHLHVIWM